MLVSETGYVKASEVEGDSKEVGAKVIYQGREMVVSKGINSDGKLKMRDFSGITAIADALKVNMGLSSITALPQGHILVRENLYTGHKNLDPVLPVVVLLGADALLDLACR